MKQQLDSYTEKKQWQKEVLSVSLSAVFIFSMYISSL